MEVVQRVIFPAVKNAQRIPYVLFFYVLCFVDGGPHELT